MADSALYLETVRNINQGIADLNKKMDTGLERCHERIDDVQEVVTLQGQQIVSIQTKEASNGEVKKRQWSLFEKILLALIVGIGVPAITGFAIWCFQMHEHIVKERVTDVQPGKT